MFPNQVWTLCLKRTKWRNQTYLSNFKIRLWQASEVNWGTNLKHPHAFVKNKVCAKNMPLLSQRLNQWLACLKSKSPRLTKMRSPLMTTWISLENRWIAYCFRDATPSRSKSRVPTLRRTKKWSTTRNGVSRWSRMSSSTRKVWKTGKTLPRKISCSIES